jgi:hypothetical protein
MNKIKERITAGRDEVPQRHRAISSGVMIEKIEILTEKVYGGPEPDKTDLWQDSLFHRKAQPPATLYDNIILVGKKPFTCIFLDVVQGPAFEVELFF